MVCPSCGYSLQQLSVTTTSGGRFDIDHCGRCGGTWFDPYEVNRIPYHEVTRLAGLTVPPKEKVFQLNILLCPRCHAALSPFHGDSLPVGIDFLRCPICHGIWATQRSLEVFKTHQDTAIAQYKEKGTAFPALSMVFVPVLFVALLFASTFVTVRSLQDVQENRIQATQLITSLNIFSISSTSVSILFQTAMPLRTTIAYGESVLELREYPISLTPNIAHSILLQDLTPNTKYIYHIILRDSQGRTFTTPYATFTTPEKDQREPQENIF